MDEVRKRKRVKPSTQDKARKEQPPWLTKEVEELWKERKQACKKAQRNKENKVLKLEANQAAKTFKAAAIREKQGR